LVLITSTFWRSWAMSSWLNIFECFDVGYWWFVTRWFAPKGGSGYGRE
jgi:hypothetical protein